MMEVHASDAPGNKATATMSAVNLYWHLAHANSVSSSGGQVASTVGPGVTVKETVLVGSHQANTVVNLGRVLADTIVERRGDRMTLALELQFATETVDATGHLCASWNSAQTPSHWGPSGPWRVSTRPEFARDSAGRWTGAEQSITALTTTLGYRRPYLGANAILRLAHRVLIPVYTTQGMP